VRLLAAHQLPAQPHEQRVEWEERQVAPTALDVGVAVSGNAEIPPCVVARERVPERVRPVEDREALVGVDGEGDVGQKADGRGYEAQTQREGDQSSRGRRRQDARLRSRRPRHLEGRPASPGVRVEGKERQSSRIVQLPRLNA
jgi:hypothetical protein